MTPTEPVARRSTQRAGLLLTHKLLLAAALLGLLLWFALDAVVGARTTQAFRVRSQDLVEHSMTAMRELAMRQRDQQAASLQELAAMPEDARTQEAARRAELGKRRTREEIDEVAADLAYEQELLGATFANELRTQHLELVAAALVTLGLVFGLGLHRLVVRPVQTLRAATRRVAEGDLETAVPVGSADEIGQLAADFSTMTRELRRSREQLAAFAQDLEQQVAQKTRELLHSAKMASLGTLAGGLAHEFHNLVGGIRGCAQEARRDATSPDQQETLDVILRATDRATAIVQQLRRFAQQDRGERREFELDRVVGDAVRLLQPEARRRRIDLAADLAKALRLVGDEGALHQVVVNLLTNAMQAMPSGGPLRVRAFADGAFAVVEVEDRGTGIAEADLPRLFEPFFSRRTDAPDPAQRGTGLGLSVSYGIVAAHGGSIDVQSRVGEGSTFRVRLPLDARS